MTSYVSRGELSILSGWAWNHGDGDGFGAYFGYGVGYGEGSAKFPIFRALNEG